MKTKICFVTLLTIGIVTALLLFFEQTNSKTADAFDGVFVYKEILPKIRL